MKAPAIARFLVAAFILISWTAHADYDEERKALDSAIFRMVESGITDVLLYERDTETPPESGQEMAEHLARGLYGGLPISMPIHPAYSLREESFMTSVGEVSYFKPDEPNLSTSALHDLQDWRAVLEAGTAAGMRLETFKVAEGRTAAALFNALAGPDQENLQIPVGWDLADAVLASNIYTEVKRLAEAHTDGEHALHGIALHDAECQLGQPTASPDLFSAAASAVSLALSGMSVKALQKVTTGDETIVGPGDVLDLAEKFVLDTPIVGAIYEISTNLLRADFSVAGIHTPATLDLGGFAVELSQPQLGAIRLGSALDQLNTLLYVDSSGPEGKADRRAKLAYSAQSSWMAEVMRQVGEQAWYSSLPFADYEDAAAHLQGTADQGALSLPPVITPVAKQTIRVGEEAQVRIHASDYDGDMIWLGIDATDASLSTLSSVPGEHIADCVLIGGRAGTYTVGVVAADEDGNTSSTSFAVIVQSANRAPLGELLYLRRIPFRFGEPIFYPLGPAWYETGCLSFSDPDSDPLRFYLGRSPRKGTANLLSSGGGGEYAVTVLYKIDRNDALEAHRTRGKTPYIDRFTVVAEDPFGARAQTQVEVTVDVINSDPMCVNDEATTPMGTPVEIDVLANDSDVDEDELSVVFVSTPGVGASSVSHMMIRYEPLPGFYGEDSFVYTVADGYGGETDATVTVHVVDTEPPVFVNGPGDIGPLLNDLGVCGAAVTWTEPVVNVDVTDNVGIASLLSSHTPGSVLPVGETTVTHTATDPSGNTARWTFTVTIEDDEPPMIDGMPSDMCVEAAEGETEAVVNWSPPTASDNCGVADLTSSHAPGDVFPLGDTPVTYTVEDVHGHASARAFTVTVVRTWLLACADVEVSTSNPGGTTVTFADPVAGGCGVSATCTPTSGSTFPIGTTLVTCQATDGVRTETCSFRVTVELSNRPPNARNDMVQMGDHQISIEIDVLANDSDPDGDRLNLVGVGSPSPCGDAWIAPCGDSVRFLATYCLPYLGGQATFTYTISDIHGETDAATVTIGLPDSGTMPECAPPPGGDR